MTCPFCPRCDICGKQQKSICEFDLDSNTQLLLCDKCVRKLLKSKEVIRLDTWPDGMYFTFDVESSEVELEKKRVSARCLTKV